MSDSKDSMTQAAIKLLRQSGLSGAGINQIIAESGAPKGSLYYHFPNGKSEVVEAALQAFGALVRERLASSFSDQGPTAAKLRDFFARVAGQIEANDYRQGCAVAAVVLDLDEESAAFADTCSGILHGWQDAIAAGLTEIEAGDRDGFAQFVIAAWEGAVILSRAERSTEPLINAGKMLARFGAALANRRGKRQEKSRGRPRG